MGVFVLQITCLRFIFPFLSQYLWHPDVFNPAKHIKLEANTFKLPMTWRCCTSHGSMLPVHHSGLTVHKFHYLRVHTMLCCACRREPDSWGPRGRRLQTDRSDPASRGKNQTADPESRTSRPASRRSGRSWSCCSVPRSGRTRRRRRTCGWKTSAKPS